MEQYDSEETTSLMPAEDDKMQPVSPFSCHEEEEEEDEEEEGHPTWAQNLSGSEKWRFQLARAFLHDPHVMVVHRPVDELDSNLKEHCLQVFREFVDKKGLEIDESIDLEMSKRRPRTLIFSTGSSTVTNIPDIIWRIGENGVTVERNRMPGSGGSGAVPGGSGSGSGVGQGSLGAMRNSFGVSMSPR
mmetsp:Transcript_45731/g.56080  ORF Transcript_45731/g.56080 Transcript_45731/m.56080 type:complete len:188 (+) Transcript_45731:3-566(+)